jgi:hypothetical protein
MLADHFMTVATSIADHALRLFFLFGYALLFAAVEIEIEGPHGWAERLPTWFRVTPLYARVYGFAMRSKPLTGYHLVMFFLPLWSFHIGFVGGVPWTWAAEATTLSAYGVWLVIWDFLWFVLNPRFGWKRFQKPRSGGTADPGLEGSRSTTTADWSRRSGSRRRPICPPRPGQSS